MDLDEQIRRFLDGEPFAVVGASTDPEKYGNKVLRCYQQNQHRVIPINPRAAEVEGLPAFPDLASIGEPLHGVSIITPPAITEQVVEQAIELGIGQLWMQPGAESAAAVERAEAAGLNVIHGGPCLLVVLGYHED
ncbi:MAG: putative CoA-binding protein [Planctomycetota bacterium]|jgi:predicted CoA-binding protein